jgi:lysophospholipase L1-like esterase
MIVRFFRWLLSPFLCKSLRYTALGDSIARGHGAENQFGYVYYFRDFLQIMHRKVNLKNQAIPGITSTLLLVQLKLDMVTRKNAKKAQVITLNIGGDNLIFCSSDNYNSIDDFCAQIGAAAFKFDWPKILHEIRNSIGSTSKIYVMTLYNPYKGNDPNYTKADHYIKQINSEILDPTYMSTYNYDIADVYTKFNSQLEDESWKVCACTHFCETTRDPHPTDIGHKVISRMFENIYR